MTFNFLNLLCYFLYFYNNLNFFQVWFKNRRAKCRQQVSQAKDSANSSNANSNNNKTNIKTETKSPNSKNNSSITAVPSETSPASSLTGSECATPGSAGLDGVPNSLSHNSALPPPPPLLMQPINSFSLNNSHHGGGHHAAGLHQGHDPYADPQTPSPYNNHWVPTGNLAGSNDLQPPTRSPSSSTSLVMQVKASNVSPSTGSPGPSAAGAGGSDLACEHCGKTFSDRSMLKNHVAENHPWTVSAAAAAAGHSSAAAAMTHQSYPHVPTYHHPNPYYPPEMGLASAYFGGQHQYNTMAANTAAHMFRSEYVDAYQQAAHAADAGLYQRL